MELSRATFYEEPDSAADDTATVEAIAVICNEFEHYGWRRVRAALRQKGTIVNHKKIRRLMREHDLQPKTRRWFTATTDSDHNQPIFPNLARDIFPKGPNQLWVADITYVTIIGGFAYVAVDHGRIELNEYLQSVTNPRVYAAGDAAGVGPPLTPVSSHDAKVIATNLLEGPFTRPDYRGVPSVAFTLPLIAGVGFGEEQARQQGLRFRINAAATPDWFTARRLNERVYGHKVLIEEDSDQILGAHIVGPQADEVINLFALAIRHRLKTGDLKTMIFAYPTAAFDIGYML